MCEMERLKDANVKRTEDVRQVGRDDNDYDVESSANLNENKARVAQNAVDNEKTTYLSVW